MSIKPIRQNTFIHIIGWVTFFIVPLLLSPPGDLVGALFDLQTLGSLLIRNVLLMVLFYANLLYLAPVILQLKGWKVYLPTVLLAVVIISIANWRVHQLLVEPFMPMFSNKFDPPMEPPGFREYIATRGHRPIMFASPLFSSFLISCVVVVFSTTLYLWDDRAKVKELAQAREFEKVNAELVVLKLQISPHFLFNTLNNIRWLTRSDPARAEDAVLKLSELLRYILYQTSGEKTELEKEVKHTSDFVALQKIRLIDPNSAELIILGDFGGIMIVPLLFIPLLENFFKYGDFNAGFTNIIRLHVAESVITFETVNKILKVENATDSKGIGLVNVKKRLQLHYPGHHEFVTQSFADKFHVTLRIKLY